MLGATSLLGACIDTATVDNAEMFVDPAPVAEFDPGQSIIPLPHALLMDQSTGRVTLPPSCGEVPSSSAERLRLAINQLDGFGLAHATLTLTSSEPLAASSLTGHVFLLRLQERDAPILPPEAPIDLEVTVAQTPRSSADCSATSMVSTLLLRPLEPLKEASTYAVVLTAGVQTERGEVVQPSATWALVRQSTAPVAFDGSAGSLPSHNATPFDPGDPQDLQRLRGLDLLWRGHAPLLTALDQLSLVLPLGTRSRSDLLLAWSFRTQTISDPLDAAREGSPANLVSRLARPLRLEAPAAGSGAAISVRQWYASALPGASCDALGCDAIGAIHALSPATSAPTFHQVSFLAGDTCTGPGALAGGFEQPLTPAPVCERELPLLIALPAAAPPTSGYPVVVFGHGFGRTKEDLFALAGALASRGIASVAMDSLDHGVRAAQVSSDAALGCDGPGPDRPCVDALSPSCAPQCFAPLLSPNLVMTRDHLRQTVLDQLGLAHSLSLCSTPGACGPLLVDPARIGYVGHSLGAIIGSVTASRAPEVTAAVLNVGGADWLEMLTGTQTDSLRCPLVDSLIGAGVLSGEAWDGGGHPDALCLSDGWKQSPGFLQFATAARWILDPVEPLNHVRALRGTGGARVLLTEVDDDTVVPNSATRALGESLGLVPVEAAPVTSPETEPTPATLLADSAWIRYVGAPADALTGFPGNTYGHSSLLQPAPAGEDDNPLSGQLGTLQLQRDTVAFLTRHLGGK